MKKISFETHWKCAALIVACLSFSGNIFTPQIANAQSSSGYQALLEQWLLGRCHQGWCGRFYIVRSEQRHAADRGSLYKVDMKYRGEVYGERLYNEAPETVEESVGVEWIFCSKISPAVIYERDGKWVATFLKPGREDAKFGFNEWAYATYYAVCHRTNKDIDENFAKRLGYSFRNGDLPKDKTFQRPEEIFFLHDVSSQEKTLLSLSCADPDVQEFIVTRAKKDSDFIKWFIPKFRNSDTQDKFRDYTFFQNRNSNDLISRFQLQFSLDAIRLRAKNNDTGMLTCVANLNITSAIPSEPSIYQVFYTLEHSSDGPYITMSNPFFMYQRQLNAE